MLDLYHVDVRDAGGGGSLSSSYVRNEKQSSGSTAPGRHQLLTVDLEWDDEGMVWVAYSDDIPGLVLQDANVRTLMSEVSALMPVLLVANCGYADEQTAALVDLRFVAKGPSVQPSH